jgi:hypothetical protein
MKKKLMHQQESRIKSYLQKTDLKETIGPVWKYVIDSVIDDKFRLLISKPKKPVLKEIKAAQLARFNLWKECDIVIVETKNAFKKIGVPKDQIREGAVFVRLGEKTFEITEFVRQEVKDYYVSLLEREFTPYRGKSRRKST